MSSSQSSLAEPVTNLHPIDSDTSGTRSSRREMLKQSLIASGLMMTNSCFVHASDKSGKKLPRVGSGEFTYECIHDWGNDSLPAGHEYGNASHGVAVDQQGLVYITHAGTPASLFVFDQQGKFVRSMAESLAIQTRGKSGAKATSAGRGHGIDIRREGNEEFIYLSPNETTMSFTKMNLQGEIVWQRGQKELDADSKVWDSNPKLTYRPTNTSFRPDGGYYLGDGYGSGYLFHYDRDDKFVSAIGGPGTEDGKFNTPHGHWLDDRDGTAKLVVADRANKRLQWFDMKDSHVRTMDGFLFPADIDSRGSLLLVPDLHARVTILDETNKPVAQLGDDEEWREQVLADKFAMRRKRPEWKPGRFVHPHDACFDADGNIYVVEWVVSGRVSKLVHVNAG